MAGVTLRPISLEMAILILKLPPPAAKTDLGHEKNTKAIAEKWVFALLQGKNKNSLKIICLLC